MAAWQHHKGQAVALARANVDTDQLIPARFMAIPRAEGYAEFLLHDVRRDETGVLRRDLALNNTQEASVLIAGPHFGSGSSREAAVYALVDAGFRAVFAPSFGDIFAGNAVNNGLLPARITLAEYEALISFTGQTTCAVEIDLVKSQATFKDMSIAFTLDETWRMKLMKG